MQTALDSRYRDLRAWTVISSGFISLHRVFRSYTGILISSQSKEIYSFHTVPVAKIPFEFPRPHLCISGSHITGLSTSLHIISGSLGGTIQNWGHVFKSILFHMDTPVGYSMPLKQQEISPELFEDDVSCTGIYQLANSYNNSLVKV